MKTYLVGGAVRDMLLGFDPKDKDYVVVGATVEDMTKAGYQKVGADFPVFLHPVTGDEYALARKERSNGNGYHDFEVSFGVDVTLEEDLMRRDLTINAMAMDDGNNPVDPFGGKKDLEDKVLRHVSNAFMEDPVRVLRVARFMARFGPEWSVNVNTYSLMVHMVNEGMLDSLTPERVWKEVNRALTENHPDLFFKVLDKVGALKVIFPVLEKMKTVEEPLKYHPEGNTFDHTMLVLKEARKLTDDPKVMFAALTHDFGKTLTDPKDYPAHHGHENTGVALVEKFSNDLKVPADFKKTAMVVCKNHMKMKNLKDMKAKTFVKMFVTMGAVSNPHLVDDLVTVAKADARGKLGFDNVDVSDKDMLKDLFMKFQSVKFMDEVKKAGLEEAPKGLAAANFMHQARVRSLKEIVK